MNYLINRTLDRFLNPETSREFSPIFDSVRDLRFTVTDVGISSRLMSYWAKEKLLFEDFREQKWRKLDLVSVLWMKMITQMRNYGLPFEIIRKIRNELQPLDLMAHIFNSEDLRSAVLALAEHDPGAIPDVEEILKDPEFREEVRSQLPNFLKILILQALIGRDHLAILVNREGFFIPYTESLRRDYLETPELRTFLMSTYLTVSITDLLIEFFKDHDPIFLCEEMRLLTEEEAAVLKAIKQPGVKSVTVKLFPNKEFDLLETVREIKVDRSSKLYEILLRDSYQEIKIITQKGDIVQCENTTRQRLNKIGIG